MNITRNTKDSTRVFFVVDSREDNEEIFDTLEEAQAKHAEISARGYGNNPRLYVAKVKNAYREMSLHDSVGEWNYDDQSDTFEIVAFL